MYKDVIKLLEAGVLNPDTIGIALLLKSPAVAKEIAEELYGEKLDISGRELAAMANITANDLDGFTEGCIALGLTKKGTER